MKKEMVLVMAAVLGLALHAQASYWRFEEGTNGSGALGQAPTTGGWIVNSASGMTLAGTVTQGGSGPQYVSAASNVPGYLALKFTGSGDYVTIPNNTDLNLPENRDYTIELFFRVDGNDSDGAAENWIVNKDYSVYGSNGWGVYYNKSTGKASFAFQSNVISSTTSVNDGLWHQVAITHAANSGVLNMYLDKNQQASLNCNWGSVTSGSVIIGEGYGWQAPRNFIGAVDEFRITNAVLSPSQFVPEPASVLFLALSAIGLVARKERK